MEDAWTSAVIVSVEYPCFYGRHRQQANLPVSMLFHITVTKTENQIGN